jgi:hypothetical protein
MQVVKGMAKRQNDPSTEISLGGVGLVKILPGMPARQVLPPMRMRANRFADEPFLQPTLHRLQPEMATSR